MRILCDPLLVSKSSKRNFADKFKSIEAQVEFLNGPSDFEVAGNLLSKDEADAILMPLMNVPLRRNSAIKIWALMPLLMRKNALVVHNSMYQKGSLIPLELGTKVNCTSEFIESGLKKLRSDLSFVSKPLYDLISEMASESLKAGVVPVEFLNSKIRQQYHVMDLHEREFGHTAGQGALAVIAKNDSPFGNYWRMFYNKETVISCNIERRLREALNGKLNVHVEKDGHGNFHIWVFSEIEGVLKKVHFSQSTRNGIVDKVINELKE